MVNTEKTHKFTVHYKGGLFVGDTDGWNEVDTHDWRDAKNIYDMLNGIDVYITDNYYGVTFINNDWY